jgi:hypothetical protein
MNPELYGPLMERLFEYGAIDVTLLSVYMKKNRPGTQIQVLCHLEGRQEIMELIFNETTTIDLRYYIASRCTLPRESVIDDTSLGPVQVKRVTRQGGRVVHYPEFEACKRAARE